ncbi:hypothetical protein [Pseudodesulfovibrio indicus]|uniref:hypothetical protein n=1 Tax=Pseudodesulfovibrio indicus TaxID=1716143 RepID=UPI00292EC124|nr:hypothetical protein [Pseudodesulfovibrio indicus]
MGVVVGTAFLAGLLGKAVLVLRQRKKAACPDERSKPVAEETTIPGQNHSTKQ